MYGKDAEDVSFLKLIEQKLCHIISLNNSMEHNIITAVLQANGDVRQCCGKMEEADKEDDQ